MIVLGTAGLLPAEGVCNNCGMYRVNTPAVVRETLDNEAVIINLDTGTYYSLAQGGCAVWDRLCAGAAPAAIAPDLAPAFGVASDDLLASIEALLGELATERLLVPHDGPAPAPWSPAAGPFKLSELKLQRYTDLQDLLVLDPIHETDIEAGWPHRSS